MTLFFIQGLWKDAKTNEMRIGICSRTKDVVEPMMKPQWYIKCSGMGKEALGAAIRDENSMLEIIPRQYTADWKRWFNCFLYFRQAKCAETLNNM